MADETQNVEPKLTDVSAAENALVGDEAVQGARYEPEAEVVREDVQAQLPPEPSKPAETVPVNEFYMQMDQVVTDPSSPEAVQIPDAGRGTLDLPVHVLARGTYDQQVESGLAAELTPENSPTAQATGGDNEEPYSPSAENDPAMARESGETPKSD